MHIYLLHRLPVLRVLLFNCTGMRNVENLLDPLSNFNFDLVVFSPNRKTVTKDSASGEIISPPISYIMILIFISELNNFYNT